jgi:hypothetical protein
MDREKTTHEARDLLRNRWIAAVVFWLPVLALIAGGFPAVGQGWRTAIWVIALSTMGVGCIANALRCGRVHCYLTGPFLVIMAVVALLYGLAGMPFGAHGWNMLALTVLIGTVALWFIPEVLFGRYRQGRVISPPLR